MKAIVITVGLVLIAGVAGGQSPPIIPGEVLVRFATGTDGAKAVRRSALANPPDLASLERAMAALGERAGVPLRPVRVGSGDWLVVRVAAAQLAERTAARLASCRAVVRAVRENGDSTRAVVRLAFRDGSAERRLLASPGGPEGTDRLDSLVSRMARRVDLPLVGTKSGDQLLVEVALDSLTLRVVERLKQLPEIESAQPNYRLRGVGPRAP